MQMEPEIIELPFQSEEWITFDQLETIKNVSMVRIILPVSFSEIEDKDKIYLQINRNFGKAKFNCSSFRSLCLVIKKSKYGKIIDSENSHEIVFSSKLFNLDYFANFVFFWKQQEILQYKKVDINNPKYSKPINYYNPFGIIYNVQCMLMPKNRLGILMFVENNSLDKHTIKVVVNGKDKYTSCLDFYSDTISAHFLQLNNLTLNEIANIYDNKHKVKQKTGEYFIDFLDNIVIDLIVFSKKMK